LGRRICEEKPPKLEILSLLQLGEVHNVGPARQNTGQEDLAPRQFSSLRVMVYPHKYHTPDVDASRAFQKEYFELC
jgi:hypothetical protein